MFQAPPPIVVISSRRTAGGMGNLLAHDRLRASGGRVRSLLVHLEEGERTLAGVERVSLAFAGRAFGPELLATPPPNVDPCGERGEFHGFGTDTPVSAFRRRFTRLDA